MNPRLKSLLDLWPQIVAGYHKSCDHYWQFVGEYNVVSEDIEFYLKHDGYCYFDLNFGPFDCFMSLMEWDGEDLRQEMLDICREELEYYEGGKYFFPLTGGYDPEMPKQHWEQLIEKLENL